MKFDISSVLSYEAYSPVTYIFNIQAARTATQSIISETLTIEPYIPLNEFSLGNGTTRYVKTEVQQGAVFTLSYDAVVEVQHWIIDEGALPQNRSIMHLDTEVLPYLFPSRHCQADKLRKFAIKEFGYITNQFDKVLAINNWIFHNIDYISGTTDSGTSAYDTLIQREGVCKDFAHLGIALCRALDVPARYFTGYAHKLYPPDFHACFEAYIGGHWIFFDPTGLVALNGLVKIAHSKDASEAPVASFFGNTHCTYMNIQCTAETGFLPFGPYLNNGQVLSYG
jgi:transglutaminase-like putative cysteine protease